MHSRPLDELNSEIRILTEEISKIERKIEALSPPLLSELDIYEIEDYDAQIEARENNEKLKAEIDNNPEIKILNSELSELNKNCGKLINQLIAVLEAEEIKLQPLRNPTIPEGDNQSDYKFVRAFKLQTRTINQGDQQENYGIFVPSSYDDHFFTQLWPLEKIKDLAQFQTRNEYDNFAEGNGIKAEVRYTKTEYDRSIYPQQNTLFIVDMFNYTSLKNIGKSLHEAVFRLAIDLGTQGRVCLDASWGSDTFHFLEGFRGKNEDFNNKLQSILGEKSGKKEILNMIRSDGNWGSHAMSLLEESIQKKLTKFDLADPAPLPAELKYVYLPENNLKEFKKSNYEPIYRIAFATEAEANEFLTYAKTGRIVKMSDLSHLQLLEKNENINALSEKSLQTSPVLSERVDENAITALLDKPSNEIFNTLYQMLEQYNVMIQAFLDNSTNDAKKHICSDLLNNLRGIEQTLKAEKLDDSTKLDSILKITHDFADAEREISKARYASPRQAPLSQTFSPLNANDIFQQWKNDEPLVNKLVSILEERKNRLQP